MENPKKFRNLNRKIILLIECVKNNSKREFMNKIINYIFHPWKIILSLSARKHFGVRIPLTDKRYLKLLYWDKFKKRLNLDDPKTFNEKLQWLKLYNRNPLYTQLVDKYLVKDFVASIIGDEHIIPTIGVWEKFEDIDFDVLPDKFVLKCTHDSGGLVICKNKKQLDIDKAKNKITACLERNFYWSGREWPYKNVKPRIIVENYIEDGVSDELKDFKFMCFDGKVRCSFVCSGRSSEDGLKVTFYDTDWNRMPFIRHYPSAKESVEKPLHYNEMVQMAEKLAKDIPFVRVDFYEVLGKIYFGELTFYPGSGLEEFIPSEWDRILGEWIPLEKICKKV